MNPVAWDAHRQVFAELDKLLLSLPRVLEVEVGVDIDSDADLGRYRFRYRSI